MKKNGGVIDNYKIDLKLDYHISYIDYHRMNKKKKSKNMQLNICLNNGIGITIRYKNKRTDEKGSSKTKILSNPSVIGLCIFSLKLNLQSDVLNRSTFHSALSNATKSKLK